MDHIDLDHKTSVTETPEITGNTEQASEPEEMPEVQTPASETKEEIPEVKEEPQEPGTPFKLAQPALKDVKVVGTIDLDAINQRTRPPKKSKQEKERDRKELRKSNKPVATSENTISQDMSEIAGEEDSDIRKKRKRIHRQDEKVQLEPLPSPNKNAKIEENKRKLKKL